MNTPYNIQKVEGDQQVIFKDGETYMIVHGATETRRVDRAMSHPEDITTYQEWMGSDGLVVAMVPLSQISIIQKWS